MNWLSTTEQSSIGNDMDTVFDTLSYGRVVTVVKEPLKTLVGSPSQNNVFGFGAEQTDPTYTYTPVSGVFPVILFYPKVPNAPLAPEPNIRVYSGPVSIKVKKDCRDYILNGKTVHLLIDDKTFLIDDDGSRQMVLNSNYFIFNLKTVQ